MSGPRYSIIPAAAVVDPRLEGRDLQVLALLGTHTNEDGWCRRSQVKMAEQLRVARSTVQAALRRLGEAAYVEVKIECRRDGGDASHWYRVRLDVTPEQTSAAGAHVLSGDDTPADRSAPPAGPGSAPPAGPGSAPLTKDSNDQDSTIPPKAPKGARETRASDDEENEPGIAGEADEAFSAFFEAWPTSATDSRDRAWKAWQGLKDGERKQAGERIDDFQAFAKKQGRKFLIGADTYLRERRFVNLPKAAAVDTARGFEIKPFGPEFGAFMVDRLDRDNVTVRTYVVDNAQRGLPAYVARTLAPTAAAVAAMAAFPKDDPHVAAWVAHFKARRMSLPLPSRVPVVYLPVRPPPAGTGPRLLAADTAAIVKEITGKDYGAEGGR